MNWLEKYTYQACIEMYCQQEIYNYCVPNREIQKLTFAHKTCDFMWTYVTIPLEQFSTHIVVVITVKQ